MASPNKDDVQIDFSPMLLVYKDGRVDRIADFPFVPPSPEDPSIASKDVTISPHISARIYLPNLAADQKLPVLVWFHGGGFCIESAFSSLYHRYLSIIASEANAVAVSVEYRLAPENPLPASYDDCWEALQWVASHAPHALAEKIGVTEPWLVNHGNFDKIFIGGDSAGANIVHNTLIRAGKAGAFKISGAILSYPYFWGSYEPNTECIPRRLWDFVYPTAKDGIDNPMINPFVETAPSLSGLGCSRMFVCVGEKDQLNGAGIRYVEAVKKSGWGGEIELIDVEGEDHVFDIFDPYSEKAKNLIGRIASFIQH